MDEELFAEFVESLQEAAEISTGLREPSRRFVVAQPRPATIEKSDRTTPAHAREFEMIDTNSDRQTMTGFRRNSGSLLRQLEKSKRPMTLTVRGKATAVVQDVNAYQRLLDIAANASAEEGIRQGLEDATHGRIRPVEEFFEEFEAANGISSKNHGPR